MEVLVKRTLEKIRKETPRRLKDLRTTCDELIGCNIIMMISIIFLLGQLSSSGSVMNGYEAVDTDADKYFGPLRVACESHVPKIMEIALDAIHLLIGELPIYPFELSCREGIFARF